ncbi:hypothetical protein [Paenibacillus sp. PL91]|uniref:hypothetical protein n=1 Tax=Paenibacillus sp. PL91 TaxID=2729538 RepID=UPI00145E19E2|nr:hypothetical protein [Paenibacillus sp. PL91]MBC9203695.1 hypothetical protein [Paenibacillus sp. PL91]
MASDDRELVIRYMVGSTLPLVLNRDIEKIKSVSSMNAIVRYLESIQVEINEELIKIRAQLRLNQIKIIELVSREGIQCRYVSNGYEQRIDMLPSIIKIACDRHLQELMGLSSEE